MKMKREDLKALIKECLVEVLTEGLGPQPQLTEALDRSHDDGERAHMGVGRLNDQQRQTLHRRKPAFDPRLDAPVYKGSSPIASQTNQLMASVARTAAGGDNIMEAILADTAATTLQQQDGHSGARGSSGPAMTEQINGTPEEVFGADRAQLWTQLAFMPTKKLL